MKFTMLLPGVVYRKKEPTEYRLTNGTAGLSYKIIFDDFDNTEDLKVSKEVYDVVNKGDFCLFLAEFNSSSERKEIKVLKVLATLHGVDEDNPVYLDDVVAGYLSSNKNNPKSDTNKNVK